MSIVEKALDKLNAGRDGQRTPAAKDAGDAGKSTGPQAGNGVRGMPAPRNFINLDLAKLEAAGVIAPADVATRLAEEYRQIKRPLLANAFGRGAMQVKDGNLIMVASSLPGEGKSFTAVNLSLSVALERDRTVLLVDADVAQPRISKLFNLAHARGLIDLLLDENLSISDVLVHTDVEGLRILPAGQQHPHSTELLSSQKMHKLVQEIAHRYSDRVIIFDSPPLLATSEAPVLASLMGQIALVVEAGRTPERAVHESLETLDTSKAINLILNKCDNHGGTDYYGGYYGYDK